jgi:hypothetical protein
MRGRGYGVCILGLSLRAMLTSERLEWPQSGVDPTKFQPASLHGNLSPRVYKPTRLQPTLVIRLTGVDITVNIPASVLKFSWFCASLHATVLTYSPIFFASCCCISREETRTIRCGSSAGLTTLLGLGLGRITVVHPLPSWAVKPGPRRMYQPGANTKLYEDARLTCYDSLAVHQQDSLRCLAWENYTSLGPI